MTGFMEPTPLPSDEELLKVYYDQGAKTLAGALGAIWRMGNDSGIVYGRDYPRDMAAHDAGVRADQAEKTLREAAEDYEREWIINGFKPDVSAFLLRRAVALTPTTEETEQ